MFVSGLAWAMLTTYGWHALALACAAPATLSYLWAIFVLPESPRWLETRDRLDEAEQVLRTAAIVNGTTLPMFRLKKICHHHTAVAAATEPKLVHSGTVVTHYTYLPCIIYYT